MKHVLTLILTILAFIVSTPAAADPVEGPRHGAGVIDPGTIDAYTIMLRADETTVFLIRGDGDGDIDCVLYDGNGNVVAEDTRRADECRVSVTPRWTGTFRLVFVNVGTYASIYVTRIY